MGKSTIFRSERVMVGLNSFEPGQEHALHAHAGMDKVYQIIEGQGLFLLDGDDVPMQAGVLLVAPEGVPHGIRNTGTGRLLVLAILAPAPVTSEPLYLSTPAASHEHLNHTCDHQVRNGDRNQDLPSQAHQLVVPIPRQREAYPDEEVQKYEDLGHEPDP